ncbi:MAG: hypothetical protein ACYTBY_07900, partial [Planctomycetota bacterium]
TKICFEKKYIFFFLLAPKKKKKIFFADCGPGSLRPGSKKKVTSKIATSLLEKVSQHVGPPAFTDR